MTRAKPLPPPTVAERAAAETAAQALRDVCVNRADPGEKLTVHIDLSRPRRGLWVETWQRLPGFARHNSQDYCHTLLPGWTYTRSEVRSEMIPDLERLAATGERPTEATR